MQGPVLGFPVSGVDSVGWWQPVVGPMPSWISGGAVGLEGSVAAVAVDLVALAVLWWWPFKPRLDTRPSPGPGPGTLRPAP
jgi:hypothetical protein